MPFELKVPQVGESITEVQISAWLKNLNDYVERDEPVVEIESDKATVEIFAPVSGIVTQVLKKVGDPAHVGDIVGYMEAAEKPAVAPGGEAPKTMAAKPATTAPAPKSAAKKPALVTAPAPQTAPAASEPRVMPSAQRAMAASGVALVQVTPTGPGGRVLKEDVQRAADTPPTAPAGAAPAPAAPTTPPRSLQPQIFDGQDANGRSDKTIPMSPMRKRIAERLVSAQQSAALLTTFNEIDMSAVMALREEHKEEFQKQYGVKLGFMSFFVKASVDALRMIPQVNSEIRGTDIIQHNYCDIGIAVGSGKGLAVPIIRNAQQLSFADIELSIADFGARAKENKLLLEELQGGTFTISNGGVYGSMLSTPIVNPPQSGILGLHAIQERPVARNGQVVIRPMMYVALTYDHRIVDGREAVTFLKRIKDCIEAPSRLLIGL